MAEKSENDDIIQEREAYNVNFKQCEGISYAATFDRMIAEEKKQTAAAPSFSWGLFITYQSSY